MATSKSRENRLRVVSRRIGARVHKRTGIEYVSYTFVDLGRSCHLFTAHGLAEAEVWVDEQLAQEAC